MSQEYVFENDDFKELKHCTDGEKLIIIEALQGEMCEYYNLHSRTWKKTKGNDLLLLKRVYRVLAPKAIPNEIDWSQFPDWVKSCATDHDGLTHIYDTVAKPGGCEGIWVHGEGYTPRTIEITDFPGFKRGTVSWENSLLIKPEEE